MTLLITRHTKGAYKTAQALNARGFDTACLIIIEHQALSHPPFPEVEGYIFTSATSFDYLSSLSLNIDKTAFCVGPKTAKRAQKFGFKTVITAAGHGQALAEEIAKQWSPEQGRLLHIGGQELRVDIANLLTINGMQCDHMAIYQTDLKEQLTRAEITLLQDPAVDTVLFYSPKTLVGFMSLIEKYDLTHYLITKDALCLSQAIAAITDPSLWRAVKAADHPDEDALFSLIKG